MFEAALVAWIVALLGDRALGGLRKGLFGSPERQALSTALSVALANTLISVPDSSRDAVVPVLRDRFMEPPFYALDGRTQVRTGLINAINEQLAPLADQTITPEGKSFLEENGVDAAQLLDELAEVVICSIEQVGAKFPALAPLAAQLDRDTLLQRVDNVSELLGLALRQQSTGAGVIAARSRDDSDAEWVSQLIDAFLDVPAVANEDSLQTIFEMLPDRFRHAIPRSKIPRIQVIRMIHTSANFDDGLSSLVRAVRVVEGDTLAMARLDEVILSLGQEHARENDNA